MDFFISDLSSYVGSENASFQLQKSSGCKPNLWEWWVGEKISLGNDERQWVVDCVRQPRKNNGQFDLPCEGGKSEIGSLHGVPALEKRTLAP